MTTKLGVGRVWSSVVVGTITLMDVGEPHARDGDCASGAPRMLGGRYELRARIATGGMGSVWRALDTVLDREVAVKILKDEFVDAAGFLDRFRAEAKHAASISHAGVASVFDYGEDHDGPHCVAYLVMELVIGEPLSVMLHSGGPVPLGLILSILSQTADALQAAHDLGVVHRDVKPGNLLLVGGSTVKVTDFGISVAGDSVPLTAPGQILGTAQYMAPEQALGLDVTPASDLYALGVVGYEMVAGRPPFGEGTAAAIASAHVHRLPPPFPTSVPDGLRDLLNDALSKDPADRPASARAFADRVRDVARAVANELPLPAAPDSAPPETYLHTAMMSPVAAVRSVASQLADAVTAIGDAADARTAAMPAAQVRPEPLIDLRPDVRARKRRRLLAMAVPLTVAIVVIATMVARGSSEKSAIASTATTAAAIPAADAALAVHATVQVTAAALVNYSATDVAFLLTAQGLVVEQTTVDAPGTPAGLVVGVTPEGALPAGTSVMLTVSSGEPAAPAPAASSGGKPKGGKENGHGKD